MAVDSLASMLDAFDAFLAREAPEVLTSFAPPQTFEVVSDSLLTITGHAPSELLTWFTRHDGFTTRGATTSPLFLGWEPLSLNEARAVLEWHRECGLPIGGMIPILSQREYATLYADAGDPSRRGETPIIKIYDKDLELLDVADSLSSMIRSWVQLAADGVHLRDGRWDSPGVLDSVALRSAGY